MGKKLTPGETVWIVERDEAGYASEVSGFIFLAEVADAVIVTPRVNGCDGMKEIMEYHIQQTVEDFDTDLSVYPARDCYRSRYAANEAMYEEMEDCNG